MDWKNFLKPNKKKIITALIFFILIFYLHAFFTGISSCGGARLCEANTKIYCSTYTCKCACLNPALVNFYELLEFFIILLILSSIAYGGSCLIFNKFFLKPEL